MLVEKREQLVEIIYKAFPYPNQITELNFIEEHAIRFNWRGNKFRVTQDLFVEEVGDGVLIGSDIAILAEKLIKLTCYGK